MNRRFMHHALAALLIAGVAVPRGAQSQRAELSARLSEATRHAIAVLADSLGSAGLPADALYDKAAEGVLKEAGDAQILAAVRALARRLRDSRSLLGPSAKGEDLLAAASALYAGVPPALVRRTASAQAARTNAPSLALTLTVLGTLVSHRVPPDVAVNSLETLLSSGARALDLQAFQRAVEGDIIGGGAPADATTSRTQGVLRTIEARRPPDDGGSNLPPA